MWVVKEIFFILNSWRYSFSIYSIGRDLQSTRIDFLLLLLLLLLRSGFIFFFYGTNWWSNFDWKTTFFLLPYCITLVIDSIHTCVGLFPFYSVHSTNYYPYINFTFLINTGLEQYTIYIIYDNDMIMMMLQKLWF